MKLILHSNALTRRGDAITLRNYSIYLKKYYNINSTIAFNSNSTSNSTEVINKLKEEKIKLFDYKSKNELLRYAYDNNFENIYWLKSGEFDDNLIPGIKNSIHAVFNVVSPHGNVYAYVSEWLAKEASRNYYNRLFNSARILKNGIKNPSLEKFKLLGQTITQNTLKNFEFVPHIIQPPLALGLNFREKYGISNDSFLIGRIGGFDQFDIEYVHKTIEKILEDDNKNIFVFINTKIFIVHERVFFLNDYISDEIKSCFIKSCNMMIHARKMGESFGIAIAESLYFNVPIAASNTGKDKNHTILLKNSGLLYSNEIELIDIYKKIKSGFYKGVNLKDNIKMFSPELVINKFKKIFID